MASGVRLNKVIDLLERGQVVFSSGTIMSDNLDDIMFVADSDYDFAIIEMEHQGFDFTNLRTALQYFLNRKRLVEQGNLQPDVVPFVRIPPNAREVGGNQWVIKQTLDTGVYGFVLPHLNTVEDAQAAVVAARYPQVPGVPDFEPQGQRGWWPRLAPRYWGLTPQAYYDKADVWPLDPEGELLLMGIVEEAEGVRNIRDILQQVKGIGAIWAGPGDLSISLGKRGNAADPEVQEGLLRVLEACKEYGVPCATGASPADVAQRIEQGFRIIMAGPTRATPTLDTGRRIVGR